MDYVQRQRDPADERQMRVSLTREARRLRDKACKMELIAATGLKPAEFANVQKAIVTLR